MAQLTPMMQQYLQIKDQCKDCILFFRLGDFYEMFFEDAEIASKELELVLTGRDCGLDEKAQMCGIPYHAADSYIAKLIEKGYKVAICEQLEDPALAKGIVKRDIIKIVTPGTVTDLTMLDESRNNYIMSIYKNGEWYGLSYCDVSTGEFHATEFKYLGEQRVIDEIARLLPAEIIYNGEFSGMQKTIKYISERFCMSISPYKDECFDYNDCIKRVSRQFKNLTKRVSITSGACACGALLCYIEETQKTGLEHLNNLNIYSIGDFMVLDVSTRRNLELSETIRNQSKKGSLLWVLDKTATAMGARLLRRWVEEPLISDERIKQRLNAVEELFSNVYIREVLKDKLNGIYDIERLIGKIVYGTVNARDMISLKQSLSSLPGLKEAMEECHTELLVQLHDDIDILNDIYELVNTSINDDPPLSVKEGMIIKDGFNSEVDKLRSASRDGKKWIANLEHQEKESTGIKSLKVGYNKVFGYYIEVTNANLSMVPEDRYIRKQTLSNAERYITPELKEMESTILGAEEKVVALEYQLFCDIRDTICRQVERIQKTSWAVANIDVLCSLSEVAQQNDYIKPEISDDGVIEIKDGRHPVIERTMSGSMFVPNDTLLDTGENRVSIITGPNMAGKSTYMRQVALIVVMAQIGSFIPASSAHIGVVDRVFTRIGASDDLAAGQSTFMVEMSEVANILNSATTRSLILLDEVGRGTSTYDGLSIAWAVIEYISNRSMVGAKTLFATHYHELTELEGKVEGIKNYCISVKEHGDNIIFLRKIIRGSADQSYGIQVAKLAGLPEDLIKRAREIIGKLEENDILKQRVKENTYNDEVAADVRDNSCIQLDIFSLSYNDIIERLKSADILNMTPIQAMNFLYDIVKELK
jgi:DNA mismatch repair protein MutS